MSASNLAVIEAETGEILFGGLTASEAESLREQCKFPAAIYLSEVDSWECAELPEAAE